MKCEHYTPGDVFINLQMAYGRKNRCPDRDVKYDFSLSQLQKCSFLSLMLMIVQFFSVYSSALHQLPGIMNVN